MWHSVKCTAPLAHPDLGGDGIQSCITRELAILFSKACATEIILWIEKRNGSVAQNLSIFSTIHADE